MKTSLKNAGKKVAMILGPFVGLAYVLVLPVAGIVAVVLVVARRVLMAVRKTGTSYSPIAKM